MLEKAMGFASLNPSYRYQSLRELRVLRGALGRCASAIGRISLRLKRTLPVRHGMPRPYFPAFALRPKIRIRVVLCRVEMKELHRVAC
jgi:hypothetical protein